MSLILERKKLGLAVNCISVQSTSIFGFNLLASKGFFPIASFWRHPASAVLCDRAADTVHVKPSSMKKQVENIFTHNYRLQLWVIPKMSFISLFYWGISVCISALSCFLIFMTHKRQKYGHEIELAKWRYKMVL